MAVFKLAYAFVSLCAVSNAQRPFYAGLQPIGFPEIESELPTDGSENDVDLPIEAEGDKDLIKQIDQWPEDKIPFWFLNAHQYGELRKNPQTYFLRPNGFVDRN